MAEVILEKIESGSSSSVFKPDGSTPISDKVSLIYTIEGVTDRAAAEGLLAGTSPAAIGNLVRKDCGVDPNGAEDLWTGTVHYERPEKAKAEKQTGDRVLSFDMTGGTQHITQSRKTVARYGAGVELPAADFRGAIGVTHDSVEGCDITVPTFRFSVTLYVAAASMTAEYLATLYNRTGKVNADKFSVTWSGQTYNFAAGEVLFLGPQGSERGTGADYELQLGFAANPNRTGIRIPDAPDWTSATTYAQGDLVIAPNADYDAWSAEESYELEATVGHEYRYYTCILANTNHEPPNSTYWQELTGVNHLWQSLQASNLNHKPWEAESTWWQGDSQHIFIIDKKGWEWMWIRYEDDVDSSAKRIIKKPVSVYIEQVYETANFADLNPPAPDPDPEPDPDP